MLQRNTAARLTVAAFSSLALVVSASPAIAGPDATLAHDRPVEGTGKANYDYTAQLPWWSGVAVRPAKKANIALYGDEGRTNLLAKSKQKNKAIDVVVVDSNHADTGTTYYPTVTGKGKYQIEADYNNEDLTYGTSRTAIMRSTDVLWSMDTLLAADAEISITASTNGDNDIVLLVFQSSGESSPTWYQGRASAICDEDSGGAGATEKCDVIINDTDDWDHFAVMVLNKKGTGTINVERSF